MENSAYNNNLTVSTSYNEANANNNDSTLKGTCTFKDGYQSFYLTETLYENSDGSYDLKVEICGDGAYVLEYNWAVRHKEIRLTKQQAEDWMNRYSEKTLYYDRLSRLPEKTFIPIDDEKKISEEYPNTKYLRVCISGIDLRFLIDDELFFGDFNGHSTIWPSKEAIVDGIREAAGGESVEFKINPEDIKVVVEDNDYYRQNTTNGFYLYIAGKEDLLTKIYEVMSSPLNGVSIEGEIIDGPFVTPSFMLKTIAEWEGYDRINPELAMRRYD